MSKKLLFNNMGGPKPTPFLIAKYTTRGIFQPGIGPTINDVNVTYVTNASNSSLYDYTITSNNGKIVDSISLGHFPSYMREVQYLDAISLYNVCNNCRNIIGSPVCGDNVVNMALAYNNCVNLTGSPVCGPNVTNMYMTYFNCYNITGSPVCGDNVVNMEGTYVYCQKLTGQPVCGDNVTTMCSAYHNATKLTGNPVCGSNVVNMFQTYRGCYNITGSPVCGEKVTNMAETYMNCRNLTGSPVCGDNVTNMREAYTNCYNLTGPAIVGRNVTDISHAYRGCKNIGANAYLYSNNVSAVAGVFSLKDANRRLNVYVHDNTTTLSKCLATNGDNTITSTTLTWTNDMDANGHYYCNDWNVYIYPVENVQAKYEENELNKEVTIAAYTADTSGIVPTFPDSFEYTTTEVQNTTNSSLYDVTIIAKSIPTYGRFNPSTTGRNIVGVTHFDVESMSSSFWQCSNLKGSPVCGNNVKAMYDAYDLCKNITGSAACGPNVTDMNSAYAWCENLTTAVCGDLVTDMNSTYMRCYNILTPVCGPNVETMFNTYEGCIRLIGPAVCGDNVTNMYQTYKDCYNLTGSPVCGNNVTNMSSTYNNCYSLTGSPVCGPNVTNMRETYFGCYNLHGNMYMLSDNVTNVFNCFYNRNISNTLNVYVKANSTTFNTITKYGSYFAGSSEGAVDAMATDGYYYIAGRGIRIYPVENVAAIKEQNGD